MLWKAITVIEAREVLLAMRVESAPHMKKGPREKFVKEMTKLAYPNRRKNYVDKANVQELVAMLKG